MRHLRRALHDLCLLVFFFFNDTATTEIYTLSLHDALPIFGDAQVSGQTLVSLAHWTCCWHHQIKVGEKAIGFARSCRFRDRKSTRLNSSHANISYAVFCLKKKKKHFY